MRIGWIVVVIVLVFAVFRSLKTHFICSKCGENFKVSVLKYIFAPHLSGKRMAKCPSCGYAELLVPKCDKK
ncbi:hypothetical protein [Clostridium sp. BL-8]|uniref:hypothetical protein n=1 Tax=Clostridium sp. BL-8 TaxID=349938 RepID=UPI00098CB336|nr:hypothetical protein [Clostridium sp. BL-8]OOM72952.1 hypothetical protein CLOBL_47790 [Clostridium sp. BL-8]